MGATFHPAATNSLELISEGIFAGEAAEETDEALGYAVFPFSQWMAVLAPELLKAGETGEDAETAEESWRDCTLEKALESAAGESSEIYGYEIAGLDRLEDLVRDLPERVTFRQNLVLVVARSDSLMPNGRVAATTRTLFLLHRDSWTGRWFVVDQIELR